MKKQIKLFLFVLSLASLSLTWSLSRKNNNTQVDLYDSSLGSNVEDIRLIEKNSNQDTKMDKFVSTLGANTNSEPKEFSQEAFVKDSNEFARKFLALQRDIDGAEELETLVNSWAQDPERVNEAASQMIDKKLLRSLYGDSQAEVRVFFNEVLIAADRNNPNGTLSNVISTINKELSQEKDPSGRRDLDLVDLFTGYLNNRIGKETMPIDRIISELGFTKSTLPALRTALFYHSQKTKFTPDFVESAKSELKKLSGLNSEGS